MFFAESWFWRGTQSAIFFYISCAPCVDYKYKRQRRKEAARSEKEKAEIITTQPGVLIQPGPFQTNPDWAEEIIRGPGPPKGWKKDKMLQGFTEDARERYRKETQAPRPPVIDPMIYEPAVIDSPVMSDFTDGSSSVPVTNNLPTITFVEPENPRSSKPAPTEQDNTTASASTASPDSPNKPADEAIASASEQPDQSSRPRPSMDRRLSTAMENIKDTIKGWNFKRYEREDEILSGLNEKLSRMWDKATTYGAETGADIRKLSFPKGRKRAGTTESNESERFDYQRAVRNPEINEMHPPAVSQLPATRDAAAWILLPPPSAAVMAGRSRPQDEPALRWPLARIGRDRSEWIELEKIVETLRVQGEEVRSRSSTNDSRKTPDLSNSSSDESQPEDEEDEEQAHTDSRKRHSAPIEGWTPVKPRPAARMVYPTVPSWQREEVLNRGRSY